MDIYSYDPVLFPQEEIHNQREYFIKNGQILDRKKLRPFIAESWERSRKLKIDPLGFSSSSEFPPLSPEKNTSEHKNLVSVAKPFMENLYSVLGKSHYIVVLYSADGYHLIKTGQLKDDVFSKYSFDQFMKQCFREENIGTCGFSLVQKLGSPVQIVGPEHYLLPVKTFCGSYAPILDEKQALMGVIGIVSIGRSEPHLHTLGMVLAASKAIENDVRQANILEKTHKYGFQLRTTIDSISDVLICLDSAGKVADINKKAEDIFGITAKNALGNHISQILKSKPDLNSIIEVTLRKNESFFDHEIKITTPKNTVRCIVSIKPIDNPGYNEVNIVLLFKKIERIRKIVNKLRSSTAIYSFKDIIGVSDQINSLKAFAKKAARSNSSIIIEGESGTGKELMAHSIHNSSLRSLEPFVIVNCSTIPKEMFESTLFGYEKGTFTGAKHEGHTGKFESADGGSIFLDEIGELPLDMQVKLLRFLDGNTIDKLGSNNPLPLDVRIIAATNRNLMKEVAKETFRLDLYYRLNVLIIRIPPIRERRNDITALTTFFLDKYSEQTGINIKSVAPRFLDALYDYDWPGNIRELANVIERALNILDGDKLDIQHLPDSIITSGDTDEKPSSFTVTTGISSLKQMEKEHIKMSIKIHKGNKSQVAQSLGISRDTLYRKLKEYVLV